MSSRLVQFDTNSLLKLLTHYSNGEIPLSAEIVNIGISPILQRWVALTVEADSWVNTPYEAGDGYGGQMPYMFRYEGKRVLNLQHLQDPVAWSDENEIQAPSRTD